MLTLRTFKNIALVTACTGLLSWIKISSFIGAATAGFSLSHCLSPLIGLLAGGTGAMAFFCIRTLLHIGKAATVPAFIFACHLPTLAAALYLSMLHTTQYTISRTKKLLIALIPVSCMILFCLHPTGGAAWAYALFWLIPLTTLFTNHTNLFAHMLGSTFMAHAVGSVVWLYLGPALTPAAWLALIPIVMLERLVFASGMLLGYHAISSLRPLLWFDTFFAMLRTLTTSGNKSQSLVLSESRSDLYRRIRANILLSKITSFFTSTKA